MASTVRTVSGSTTTYVITGENAATVTLAVTQNAGSGITSTLATSGGVSQDAAQTLVTLMQLTSTGIVP
jgi:uncharacterized protein YpmB